MPPPRSAIPPHPGRRGRTVLLVGAGVLAIVLLLASRSRAGRTGPGPADQAATDLPLPLGTPVTSPQLFPDAGSAAAQRGDFYTSLIGLDQRMVDALIHRNDPKVKAPKPPKPVKPPRPPKPPQPRRGKGGGFLLPPSWTLSPGGPLPPGWTYSPPAPAGGSVPTNAPTP